MFFSRLTHLRPRVARDCAFSTARLPRVVILDATDIAGEPVATVALGQHIPPLFHGVWSDEVFM